ncbi:MAG: glycosyltransferase family 4 protein [Minisyncoccia bacterium]
MKIVVLQDDFPPQVKGGAGIVAASFVNELAIRGHELTVITAVQDRAQVGSFLEGSVRVERIYSRYAARWRSWLSLYNPATVPEIRRILAEVKPEVVHAHNIHYHLSYWSLRLARESGARVFLTAHDVMLFHYGKLYSFAGSNDLAARQYHVSAWQQLRTYRFWYNPLRNVVIRRLLRNVGKIFAVSAALKDALVQNGITNVEVIHNGIKAEEWCMSPERTEAFVQKYGIEGKKVILFGGRISGSKGGYVMLTALRDVVQAESLAVLLLLGTRDAYVEELKQQAEVLGIGDHVVSTGWLSGDELHAAYHSATVVVMPSVYLEPFGMIALEAMACSKPVVGSCFGGIPEMIVDGETGYVVDPRDTELFARRIIDVLSDKALQYVLGQKALERVGVYFSLEKQVLEVLKWYKS